MTSVAMVKADTGPSLLVSDAARAAIGRLRAERGPMAIQLGWPAGVGYQPVKSFEAGEWDVIIGHIAGCPVYVDLRARQQLAAPRLVLELAVTPPDCRTFRLTHRRRPATTERATSECVSAGSRS